MKVRCLIIDDEPLAINVIKNYLSRFDGFDVVATSENAIDGYNILSENEVDLVFLDINMPMLNGIEFLKGLENPPLIIITTAYRDYAVESFELNVTDYLVKPISFPRFLKAINKAKKLVKGVQEQGKAELEEAETNDHQSTSVFLKVDKKMVKVPYNEILYIESLKDYVRVKTKHEDLITHQNLNGMTKILPGDMFLRIHRSYTINLEKVKAIDGNCVEIAGKLIPIGRNYQKDTKQIIMGLSPD